MAGFKLPSPEPDYSGWLDLATLRLDDMLHGIRSAAVTLRAGSKVLTKSEVRHIGERICQFVDQERHGAVRRLLLVCSLNPRIAGLLLKQLDRQRAEAIAEGEMNQ